MTRKTNSRIAGIAFLFYIAAGILSMVLSRRGSGGAGIAAKLATISEHVTEMRLAYLLAFTTAFAALALGVTLYAITREEDPDLAMLAMMCRVAEGVVGVSLPSTLVLIWLATTTGSAAPDPGAAQAIGAFLLRLEGSTSLIAATLFAVGSTIFCWLLLRGRMIPVSLAWLGVAASALLVVALPFQLAGFLGGLFVQLMWIPMAVFEVVAAIWLIVKGAAPSARRQPV